MIKRFMAFMLSMILFGAFLPAATAYAHHPIAPRPPIGGCSADSGKMWANGNYRVNRLGVYNIYTKGTNYYRIPWGAVRSELTVYRHDPYRYSDQLLIKTYPSFVQLNQSIPYWRGNGQPLYGKVKFLVSGGRDRSCTFMFREV